ncbi:MAG: amidohydrolase [Pegethrix bostrychoides GSE-TBD4-15B]|uniref:Amidohydrolase n=1 Tax=Pegethrix bostrychoides GSE-TBD4-15B TaxID=2839662 RepID=A0A951PEC1_9CYAN|nr:amidohydrolase [Pegethrix bostrychoides GSE-TBD4-15B]
MGAEKIFRGGPILTMTDGLRQVEAVAIANGRILAAGTEAEVMQTRTNTTVIVELDGKTLMPSFIDAHGHFMNSPQVVKWANVSGPPVGPVSAIADIITVLNAHVEKFQLKPGEWIIGYGYDITNLSDGRECNRDDLDPHFPDNPVMLIHVSNHGAVMNSKAFAEVGIDASTPTPPGGIILRKPGSQEPDGLIMETAFLPVFGNMPQPSEQELLDTLDAAQQIYASAGVTTCQEGATHAKDLKFLQKGAEQGRFYLDVVSLPFVVEVPALVAEYFPDFSSGAGQIPDTAKEAFGVYKNRLKLAGIKISLDGSPQGKTAFWSQPLLTDGPGGEKNWRGQPLFPPEVVNKFVKEIYDKGIPIFCHCNGDAAIDMMIDAAEAAGVTADQDRRTVIIHSQFQRPDQLDRYVELGFSPSYFTTHTFFWGKTHVENTGKERAYFISPMASAMGKGLRCSNHSDFSVTPMDPMRMAWSTVTRQSREGEIIGPDERVDVWLALKALTIEAAWQIREEDSKGTIEVGKLADLVILDGNPLTVATDQILNIKVIETMKEGVKVYPKAA